MNRHLLFLLGIFGVSLFGIASTLGAFQFDDYDPVSQLISETMAIETPYGKALRYFGYIPSGILLTIFAFAGYKKLPKSYLVKFGFWGLGIFYGVATIIIGIFPCDKGCNKAFIAPSISQIIHNLTGGLTYLFVPICMIMIGVGLQKSKSHPRLSKTGVIGGVTSLIFVGFLSDPSTNYAGLFQRIIESIFIIWVIACSISIKRKT